MIWIVSFGQLARTLLVLSLGIMLCGCLHRNETALNQKSPISEGLGACCLDPERQPDWLVDLVEPAAPLVGRAIAHVAWRKGRLSDTARQAVMDRLQPFDLVVVSNKGRMSGHTIPGLFGHVAIYVGNEGQLRQAAVWDDPNIVPHQARIRAGATVIEADQDGIHLSKAKTVLNTDRVVVLRPRPQSEARRRRALADLFQHVGNRFDFHFDNSDPSLLYCAELISHVMPELNLPSRQIYGRNTTLPDEIVAQATQGRSRLTFLLYVRSRERDWESATRRQLAADLAAAWR